MDINPDGTELCDGQDNNCDEATDESFQDIPGFGESTCDELDNDCDGEADETCDVERCEDEILVSLGDNITELLFLASARGPQGLIGLAWLERDLINTTGQIRAAIYDPATREVTSGPHFIAGSRALPTNRAFSPAVVWHGQEEAFRIYCLRRISSGVRVGATSVPLEGNPRARDDGPSFAASNPRVGPMSAVINDQLAPFAFSTTSNTSPRDTIICTEDTVGAFDCDPARRL